jgi:hypothetical protein
LTEKYYLPSCAFFGNHSRDAAKRSGGKRWNRGLHSDLDSLKRAERNVRYKLRRRTGSQVNRRPPFVSDFLANEVAIELLEKLVSAVFECTLCL